MRLFLIILFSFLFFGLYAQNRDSDFGDRVVSNNGEGNVSADSLVVLRGDTLSNDVFAFSLDRLSKQTYSNDTSLIDFEEYELTNTQETPYIHLGNPGSSTTPLFFQNRYQTDFNLGIQQYRPYQMTSQDIRFYNLEKPYSKVYFSPGSSQASFRSSAILARDFANDVKVSIHFNRVNTAPIYLHSDVRNTYFHGGVYQKIDSTRFAYSVNFLNNANYEEYNGGILDEDALYQPGGEIRSSIRTLLSGPYQYNLNRTYNARGYYFVTDKDSTKQYVQLSLDVHTELYKFIVDGITSNDTIAFTDRLITDEIGMRRHIQNNGYGTKLSYHIENKRFASSYFLKYRWNRVHTDLNSLNIQTILVGTRNEFEWKGLSVNLDGHIGTSYNTFLIDLHPYTQFKYRKYADIKVGFRLHTEPSPFYLNSVEVTENQVIDLAPFTISSQELYGYIGIPIVGFYGKISSFAGQNIPVMDEDGVEVLPTSINYIHIDLEEKLKYKWLRFNNRFITQIRNTSVYNMPQFYTEHELFFDGKLFNALQFNGGFNVNFIPAYSLPAFSPFYGRYYQSTSEEQRLYYRIDPFVSMKVQTFRFFVKFEYLNGLWDSTRLFQALNYPQLDPRIRAGVSWELRN